MTDYPQDLTTSDWVDLLQGKTRNEQIEILATYHRRVEHSGKVAALSNLADPDPFAKGDAVSRTAAAALDALVAPVDYPAS